jgi:hypothetical protein
VEGILGWRQKGLSVFAAIIPLEEVEIVFFVSTS